MQDVVREPEVDQLVRKVNTEILIIQKFISVLSDFHYHWFVEYLEKHKAQLPARLAQAIRARLPEFDSHDDLCIKVYGTCTEADRKKFNQLSAHTFKLSAGLAYNYPDYLAAHIVTVEKLVNTGKPLEAIDAVKFMLDIAERIDDFRTQVWCLRFLDADASQNQDLASGIRYGKRIKAVLEKEMLYAELQHVLRVDNSDEGAPENPEAYEARKTFYSQYFSNTSVAISTLAHYGYVAWVFKYNPAYLSKPEDMAVLDELEAKLQQYPYVVFPFMTNMVGNTGYIRLSASSRQLSDKERARIFQELDDYYQEVHFTGDYVKQGQLYLIAIECSYLISTLYPYLQNKDYHTVIKTEQVKWINRKLEALSEMLKLEGKRKGNGPFSANVRMLYGALYIIKGGEQNIRKGIDELEALLVLYQQLSLKNSTDGIFMTLIIAYFAIGDYEKCLNVYKRFNKVKKNKNIYEGNDEKISAYYYVAQWVLNQRPQYKEKLKALLYRKGPDKATSSLLQFIKEMKLEL